MVAPPARLGFVGLVAQMLEALVNSGRGAQDSAALGVLVGQLSGLDA